jgi:hypothetical protein
MMHVPGSIEGILGIPERARGPDRLVVPGGFSVLFAVVVQYAFVS